MIDLEVMAGYRIYSFEKLNVYKDIIALRIKVQQIISSFPNDERYDSVRQIKRATDSIGANIAEGSGRSSNFDQSHFTNMSYASALELIYHLTIAYKLNFISIDDYKSLRLEIDKISYKLNALYKFQINNHKTLKIKNKNRK